MFQIGSLAYFWCSSAQLWSITMVLYRVVIAVSRVMQTGGGRCVLLLLGTKAMCSRTQGLRRQARRER